MNYFSFVVIFIIKSQLCIGHRSHTEHEHEWDIRLSIPGEPGQDYPTLFQIPKTSFSCTNKEAGYYADVETDCQVFRICAMDTTYGFQSFLCPNGTIFNQEVAVCDWWMNVKCENSEQYFNNNIEKFNKLKLGSEIKDDNNIMLTYTMKKSYDKAKTTANYLTVQQSPSELSFQNDVLIKNSDKILNNVYIPPKQNISSKYGQIYEISASGSTSRPHYLLSNFNDFEFKQTAPQTFETRRLNNGRPYLFASNNTSGTFRNHVPAKLMNGSLITSFSKQNFQNINEQQYHWNDYDRPNQNENKENQTKTTYEHFTNQQKLLLEGISPIMSKTSELNTLIKNSKPLSRVTFKSWILTPTKSTKLIRKSTSYTPIISRKAPLSAKITSTSPNCSAPVDFSKFETGYIYNKPVNMLSKLRLTPNRPLSIAPTRFYLTPTIVKSTVSTHSKLISPTKISTHRSHFYLPPSFDSDENSRWHLSTYLKSDSTNSHNENFKATLTSPTPVYIPPVYSSFPNNKQSRTNANSDKFTFTNTYKEKKSDTFSSNTGTNKKLLNFSQLKEIHENERELDSPRDLHSHLQNDNQGYVKSSQHIASPSIELQPPFQTLYLPKNDTSKLIMLPYFKESYTNQNETPTKTVNLKISVPIEIADYLYQTNNKNTNKNSFDKSQILDLGRHNYLVLTNSIVFTNSTTAKFIPLGNLIYDKNSAVSINDDNEHANFINESSYIFKEKYQNINDENLADITNKISDLTSSQFNKNVTPGTSQEQGARINSEKENLFNKPPENNAKDSFSPPAILNGKLNSNLLHNKIYSRELYSYPVPDVSHLVLDEENSTNQELLQDDQQHTQISDLHIDLQENIFPMSQYLKENPSAETEIIKLDNQFLSNGYPAKLQAAPKTSTELNYTIIDSHYPVHNYDSLIITGTEANVSKIESNMVRNTESDKVITKGKNNKGLSEAELPESYLQNVHNFTDREIEIRLIPSISWRVDKEEDIKELLQLLKFKKFDLLQNIFFNKQDSDNENQINHFNSKIDYTVDHSVTHDKDKPNYKMSGSTYTGPSSYVVSQASIGLLEPYQDQPMKPNFTLAYDNYKPARIEDLDDRNGYRKVSPFTF